LTGVGGSMNHRHAWWAMVGRGERIESRGSRFGALRRVTASTLSLFAKAT
jgi:hypothetical protein